MEYERLSRLIGRIYDTSLPGTDWAGLLNDIADFARVETAWMVLAAPRMGLNTVIAPRSDPDIIADYQRHWWSKDPTLSATGPKPVGQITSLMTTGRDRFLSSEFYNDFWHRSGHAAERLAANLISDKGALASIGIQPFRRNECIEPTVAEAFSMLVPHMVRAVQIRCTMREVEMERDLARATPLKGALFVDRNARLILADEDAEGIIRRNGRIGIDRGEIIAGSADDSTCLRGLIASCVSTGVRGGRLDIPGEAGVDLSIEVLPFSAPQMALGPELLHCPSPAALLILSEPMRRRKDHLARLQAEFSLTPSEAQVTLELMHADGRAAVADRLGVTLATIRTHMMHIFEKLGVNSQAALISQLARAGIDPG